MTLHSADIECPNCHFLNKADEDICQKCATPLLKLHSTQGKIKHYHWVKRTGELAARFEVQDLPGLLRKGIIVEPGTNAVLVINGVSQGVLPPGEYVLENFIQRFNKWLINGIPENVVIILVDGSPIDLEFHLGGRFTSEPLLVGVTIFLQVAIDAPINFIINLLKNSAIVSMDELRNRLYPEVFTPVDIWLRQHTLSALVEDVSIRNEVEFVLKKALQSSYQQFGLKLLRARTVEFNLELYDEIKNLRAKKKILIYKEEAQKSLNQAQIEATQRLLKIKKENDFLKLAEETHNVEMEEKRMGLYRRMRQSVMSDKMHEVRSEADFENFLIEQDLDRILREKDRENLLQNWKNDVEDRERARANLLAKLELETQYELRSIELKHNRNITKAELEASLEEERIRVEAYQEIETQKQKFELERQRAIFTFNQQIQQEKEKWKKKERDLQRDEDQKEILNQLETLHIMKLNKLDEKRLEMEQEWVNKKNIISMKLTEQQNLIDNELLKMKEQHRMLMEQKKQEQDYKLDLSERMKDYGESSLLTIANPEQIKAIENVLKAKIKAEQSKE